MERSKVVIALAEIAAQGTYKVTPAGAQRMNAVFEAVANLINELEAEENAKTSVELNDIITERRGGEYSDAG
jgi:hypothetical protein